MKKITIMLDYLSGPIWANYIDEQTFEKITGVPVVDNDAVINKLNDDICDLYSSFYEFNTDDEGCNFNYEKEKVNKEKLLSLLKKLV